jgi:hypothetical protein
LWILARTVLRVIPRMSAVREMFHPVSASTSLRRRRSSSVRLTRGDVPGAALVSGRR